MTCYGQTVVVVFGIWIVGVASLAAQPVPSCDLWNTEAFFEAAIVEDVTACLEAGADPMAQAENGSTPLHRAAAKSTNPAIIEVRG